MPESKPNRGVQTGVWVAIACGVGTALYVSNFRPNLSPRNFGVVDEGKVYRSAALTPAAMKKVVEQYHVKTIVDLGGFDKDPTGGRIEEQTAAALGVERRVFPLEGDGRGNPNAYVGALRVMNDPGKQPVLVHCSTGAQRTSGAVMLYRDFVQGRPFDQTYSEAIEHKHDPKDNPNLMPYLKEWRDRIGAAFRSGGLIEGQPAPETPAPEAAAPTTPPGDR